MSAALEGVRVLDLSNGPAGGIASRVLADFGADVVKVEPPGGASGRYATTESRMSIPMSSSC